MTFNIQAP
jgi:hypothetical protein